MFSGIGGFDLALNRQGHQCIGYSEIDKYSIQTYQKNFGTEVKNYGDATKINPNELPDFDLLCGGFPCQAFSIAGKRQGFNDTRGTLFFDIARIVKTKRPKIVFLENVKGLLNHNKGETFKVIVQTLSELGYDVQWMVFNSKFFGVPQNRERVFIIGSIRGTARPEVLPFGEVGGEVKELEYAQKSDREIARVYSPTGVSPCLHLKSGGWQEPKILDCYNKKVHADRTPTLTEPHHNSIRVCELVAKTIDANYNKGNSVSKQRHSPRTMVCNQSKIRKLTPVECERLQGFPDGWTEGVSDTRRYNQLGNAVTVNVVEAIVKKLGVDL